MTRQEKIRYHQIHPWKPAADIACEPVSLYLFCQHRLLGIEAHFAGDIVMVVGAWFREPPLIVLGLAQVILARSSGLVGRPASNQDAAWLRATGFSRLTWLPSRP